MQSKDRFCNMRDFGLVELFVKIIRKNHFLFDFFLYLQKEKWFLLRSVFYITIWFPKPAHRKAVFR